MLETVWAIAYTIWVFNFSLKFRSDQSPDVNVPYLVENHQHHDTHGAKLNLGAIVALGAFGGFVFLAAIITTIVILIRR